MKTEPLLYEWDLPMRECDLSQASAEVLAKLEDMKRIDRLYRIASGIEDAPPGTFIKLAAAGSGPDVCKPNHAPLLAYCLLSFSPDCVDDLLSLGADLCSQDVTMYIDKADEDVQEWWESLVRREMAKRGYDVQLHMD